MPLLLLIKTYEWRNVRAGNTGMAINGFPMLRAIKYEESDSSEASKS